MTDGVTYRTRRQIINTTIDGDNWKDRQSAARDMGLCGNDFWLDDDEAVVELCSMTVEHDGDCGPIWARTLTPRTPAEIDRTMQATDQALTELGI